MTVSRYGLLSVFAGCMSFVSLTVSCADAGGELPVIPYPAEVHLRGGTFDMEGASWWMDPSADSMCRMAVTRFFAGVPVCGGTLPAGNAGEASVVFLKDCSLGSEHYSIEVEKDGIAVRASDLNGFIYACQTLRQMYPEVPCCRITDYPRFSYRGMHLDVSRHFFSVSEVKRYIDVMELHKMNVFHWHLTDDQGWRVEIKGYPRLTVAGAWREGRYGGYYTQEEIREIVSYAADRGITVMPEIDMPGHMQAALASYPYLGCTGGPYEVWSGWGVSPEVLCPGKETTFRFIEGVLDEIMELFPGPCIHIGGDECPKDRWMECLCCRKTIEDSGIVPDENFSEGQYLQAMFMRRVEDYLEQHGRHAVAWDEIMEGGEDTDATVMAWRSPEYGLEAAALGKDAVMVPEQYMYFDYMQALEPGEPGASRLLTASKVYGFEPVPEDICPEQASHIIGVQGNLWTERVPDASTLEYMLMPRIAALSEVQWCAGQRKDYSRFLRNIGNMMSLYGKCGYGYCTHIEGIETSISKTDGCFEVSMTTSGGDPIYYRVDSLAWKPYRSPVRITGPCVLRASVSHGDRTCSHETVFHPNKAFARDVRFGVPPSPLYTFNASEALTDGIKGNPYYPASGTWFGWQEPMDAIVDMGNAAEPYSSVSMSFYVDNPGHYFPPVWLEVQLSDDGNQYRTVFRQEYPVEDRAVPEGIRTFRMEFGPERSRFVRVRAGNPVLPQWHPAKGYYSFILTDEIIIL